MGDLKVLTSIKNISAGRSDKVSGKVMLVKPPYFTPWTPPLGIAILKSFIDQHGFDAKCFDFNIDPDLWGMHHKYFAVLQKLEDVSINDGYSKLWWILNAHMLAYANDATSSQCATVLETVIPLYGIKCNRDTINELIPLVEGFFRRLGELTDQVDWSIYSFVGTSTYTTSLSSSLFILKRVKQKYPHVRTIMGGGVFADDLALGSDNLETLVEEYHYVDHIVLGEGELLLLKLLQGELTDRKLISRSDLNGLTLPMEDIPIPDFSDLDNEMYYHLSIEGARSCPFQCSFCSETIQWGQYRKKPITLFTDQIVNLVQKHSNNAFFMGDSLMNPYINPFASELIKRKANILYDGYLRADKPVTNRGFVKMWSQSGLFRVRLGIESAAARVLDSMDKMTTPKVISDVLKTLSSEGIRTTTYWIVGFQGETEEDFQETCRFIQAHHRYIYELEAHPYYYYPYGQVGSRLHKCRSLYPDEVTDIIKFRVWDILDANPSREERYDRLRRISQLASDLGLPNIYTMAERYQAEERWQLLHPLATEIYEGTRLERGEVRPPDSTTGAPFETWKRADASGASRDSVYCYQAIVTRRLDEKVLSTSADELIRNTDILQMGLRDGMLFHMSEAGEERSLVTVYDCEADDDAFHTLRDKIIDQLSSKMRPERRYSIQVALINRGEQFCNLLLLGHRTLLDARSMALLFEDLYRIYLQLANDKPISLRPTRKPFTELLMELQGQGGSSSGICPAEIHMKDECERSACQHAIIDIGEPLTARIRYGVVAYNHLTPRETIAAAVMRTLARTSVMPVVDITVDCRAGDTNMQQTAGDLTRIRRLSTDIFNDSAIKASLCEIYAALRDDVHQLSATSDYQADLDQKSRGRVLLDMEYFAEKPWLDDSSWFAEEFIIEESSLSERYLLKITPTLCEDRIGIRLISRDNIESVELVEAVTSHLVEELEAILAHYGHFDAARQYWLKEFAKPSPEIHLGIGRQSDDGPNHLQDFAEYEIAEPILQNLTSLCGADISTVLLACFSVMVLRLSGSQDMDVVTATEKAQANKELKIAPIRIHLFWDLRFTDLVKEIENSLASGSEHEEFALDVFTKYLPEVNETHTPPAFNIGYLFCSAQGGAHESAMRRWLKQYAGTAKEFELILNVVEDSGSVTFHLLHSSFTPDKEIIKTLISYLLTIVREVAANPQALICETGITRHEAERAPETDANESFDF